jgi:Alpha/beta hydrolase domain
MRRLLALTLAGVLAATPACSSGGSDDDSEPAPDPPGADVTGPTVTGPVTGGTHDGPWNAMPARLADRYHYVEEEFFLEGDATSYRRPRPPRPRRRGGRRSRRGRPGSRTAS